MNKLNNIFERLTPRLHRYDSVYLDIPARNSDFSDIIWRDFAPNAYKHHGAGHVQRESSNLGSIYGTSLSFFQIFSNLVCSIQNLFSKEHLS